jgi:uncharacterized membrane protein
MRKEYMKVKIIVSILLTIAIVITGDATGQTRKKKAKKISKPKVQTVSFKNEVFPIIKKNCLPCHSEEQMNQSELYLESYDGLMTGGKHGKPLVAGKADSSLIIRKLSQTPPFGDQMPLKAKVPLTEAEMKAIKDWINQGAKQN